MVNMEAAVTFAAVLPGLLVAHAMGDRWLQTEHQATTKGCHGRAGRLACAGHVASYTAATAVTVGLLWAVLGLAITPAGFLLGQAVSAVTHYWADRRFTLRAFVLRFAPWKTTYYDKVPGGAEHLDQSWHWLWLLVAALLTVVA